MTVTKVADLDEAVALANASRYGLGATVFVREQEARRWTPARALRSGMTSINSVIAFASVPALPFGGIGDSGFGRIHGADGLREFARAKSITRSADAVAAEPDLASPHRQGRDRGSWQPPPSCTASATAEPRLGSRATGFGGAAQVGSAARAARRRGPGRRAASGARPRSGRPHARRWRWSGRWCCRAGTVGITEASTTRSRSTPRTRSSGSTTLVSLLAASRESPPIAQVPTGWYSVAEVPPDELPQLGVGAHVRRPAPARPCTACRSGLAAANSRAIRTPSTSGSMSVPSDR